MQHIKFNQSEIFNGPTNKTYEYNVNDADINYCIVEINGRFPLNGLAINTKCKEMAHVL